MSLEADKKNKQEPEPEPVVIGVQGYDNIKIILSKIVVPFSKFERISSAPDLYSGSEKIPFEARDPLYKSAMRQEFANAMRSFRILVTSLNLLSNNTSKVKSQKKAILL